MAEAPFDKLHRISGGSSETELKLLTDKPMSPRSGDRTVMTQTPVAKEARALLSNPGSTTSSGREDRFCEMSDIFIIEMINVYLRLFYKGKPFIFSYFCYLLKILKCHNSKN
ncbi:MAG: hypothetical protein AB7E55_26925 [Pigmentiphaga sp.]